MTWTGEIVRNYMKSQWVNNGRDINEHHAREELLALGKLYCFEAGSTVPIHTFQDSARTTPNPNPFVLDSSGCLKCCVLPPAPFRFSLHSRDGKIIAEIDNCGDGFAA